MYSWFSKNKYLKEVLLLNTNKIIIFAKINQQLKCPKYKAIGMARFESQRLYSNIKQKYTYCCLQLCGGVPFVILYSLQQCLEPEPTFRIFTFNSP